MDVLRDLQNRRALFQGAAELLITAGTECEEKNMEAVARGIYAATYVLMDQMNQVEQALAVLEGQVTRVVEVEVVCNKCGVVEGAQAIVNCLVKEEEQGWEKLGCQSCSNGQSGYIRKDREGIPTGYLLTIGAVVDHEVDARTNDERRPEAVALAEKAQVDVKELPPAKKLRATLYGETVEPLVAQVEPAEDVMKRQSIREKLNAAKAKISSPSAAIADDEENDF